MLVVRVFFSLLVNHFLLAQGNGISCEDGYIPNEGNKNCIKIVYTSATWDEAKKNCQADKGNLLIIDNEEENTFVTNKLTNGKYVWVGARNKKCGGLEFINADDTKTTYTKWNQRQPDNWRGQEMCVMIFGKKAAGTFQGRWNDYGCQKKLPYVCERAVKEKKLGCGEGYTLNEAGREKNCIKVVLETATWDQAKDKCKAENGDLIIIDRKTENDFVTDQLRSTKFAWIGTRNEDTTGGFDLVNVNGEKMGFANWKLNQPDNHGGKEHCIMVQGLKVGQKYKGLWNDYNCENQLHYVCERNLIYE